MTPKFGFLVGFNWPIEAVGLLLNGRLVIAVLSLIHCMAVGAMGVILGPD